MGVLSGRPARLAVGTAGVAMMLGAGGCGGKSASGPTAAAPAPAPAPVASAAASSAPVAPSLSAAATTAPPASRKATTSSPTPTVPAKVAASIRAAREQMAKDGVKLVRPLATKPPVVAATDVKRSTTGSLKSGGIVRLVTAHGDLTGQQELGWVAGGITRYGDDQCTQTIKTFTYPTPTFKPNLLICWRVSAAKSVVAVVVDPKGHPSRSKALAALDDKWRTMR